MEYSIVIPVFNREDLTKQCLETLRPTLEGAGAGEVIIVDNGSRPETAAVLAAFPWVRVIRNERNLGFAAACNQGTRAAAGRYVVHLNNDTVGVAGWLATMLRVFEEEPNVGIVGPKLLFPDGTLQHAGVVAYPHRFGPETIGPYHYLWQQAGSHRVAAMPVDLEVVTGACLVTPRELFLELGGFEEVFWNGYEDVDYCLKVRARGLRVRYEPRAVLFHFESQSGPQRKRRLTHNLHALGKRWAGRQVADNNRHNLEFGLVSREAHTSFWRTAQAIHRPQLTVVISGEGEVPPAVTPRGTAMPIDKTIAVGAGREAVDAARRAMRTRGDRYMAFIEGRAALEPSWLAHLINTLEFGDEVVAATYVGAKAEIDATPISADARCTLVALRNIPQDLELGEFETLDAALADLLVRASARGRVVRAVPEAIGTLPPLAPSPAFEARYATKLDAVALDDRTKARALHRIAGNGRTDDRSASIIMLSWNAPEYTKIAVNSIRAQTRGDYEIIIVDNGSEPETLAALRELDDVRIIYNTENKGFAYGCNQGIAAARGRYAVLLNNDVVVTDGWLERLIDAHLRDPLVGVTAPRSNRVAGHQLINDSSYANLEEMQNYAANRARTYRRSGYLTDRAIGFCLCIDRKVVESVGGIDPRYGTGNFEDDDFCIRVRAAGYRIYVCDDVFIHHFGSVTFAKNKIDYAATMKRNWEIFAERWGFPSAFPEAGYIPDKAIAGGFNPERHFVALPAVAAEAPAEATLPDRAYDFTFIASARNERDWNALSPTLTNYLATFRASDSVVFRIVAGESLEVDVIERRIVRAMERAGITDELSADVLLTDTLEVVPLDAHTQTFRVVRNDAQLQAHPLLEARNPAGLRRLVVTA